jgi:hypothetical protein
MASTTQRVSLTSIGDGKMQSNDTVETVRRFNQAFQEHDPALLENLVAPDCIMESMQQSWKGWRRVAKAPRSRAKEIHVSLYRSDTAEKLA